MTALSTDEAMRSIVAETDLLRSRIRTGTRAQIRAAVDEFLAILEDHWLPLSGSPEARDIAQSALAIAAASLSRAGRCPDLAEKARQLFVAGTA